MNVETYNKLDEILNNNLSKFRSLNKNIVIAENQLDNYNKFVAKTYEEYYELKERLHENTKNNVIATFQNLVRDIKTYTETFEDNILSNLKNMENVTVNIKKGIDTRIKDIFQRIANSERYPTLSTYNSIDVLRGLAESDVVNLNKLDSSDIDNIHKIMTIVFKNTSLFKENKYINHTELSFFYKRKQYMKDVKDFRLYKLNEMVDKLVKEYTEKYQDVFKGNKSPVEIEAELRRLRVVDYANLINLDKMSFSVLDYVENYEFIEHESNKTHLKEVENMIAKNYNSYLTLEAKKIETAPKLSMFEKIVKYDGNTKIEDMDRIIRTYKILTELPIKSYKFEVKEIKLNDKVMSVTLFIKSAKIEILLTPYSAYLISNKTGEIENIIYHLDKNFSLQEQLVDKKECNKLTVILNKFMPQQNTVNVCISAVLCKSYNRRINLDNIIKEYSNRKYFK